MRFWQLFIRNIKEILRDPLGLGFLLAFPLVFMLVLGAAFGGESTYNYIIGVIDKDGSQVSQTFTEEIIPSLPTFDVVVVSDEEDAREKLKNGDIRAYIVIPEGFEEEYALIASPTLTGQGNLEVDITYDESDMMAYGQITSVVYDALRSFAGIEVPITLNANPLNIENQVEQIDYIAPGIVIFGILIMIPTSARYILRDRESKFLERMLTTPTRPWEFISGYSASMVIVAALQIVFFIIMGTFFGMNIVGSVPLAFLIFFLTGLGSIGLGMVVASVTKTENQGESLSWIFSMPMAIVSGVWFPLSSMPEYMQTFAKAFPFAHAVEASQAVIIRSAKFDAVSSEVYFLIAWAVIVFFVGVFLFSRRMRS